VSARVIRTGDLSPHRAEITRSGDQTGFPGAHDGLRPPARGQLAEQPPACVFTMFSLTSSRSAISRVLSPAAICSRFFYDRHRLSARFRDGFIS
jgi:hypothetical protein